MASVEMLARLLHSRPRAMWRAMNKGLSWKLALLWAVVIFLLSSIPGRSLPAVPMPGYDKLLHALVYAVLGALCCRSLAGTLPRALAVSAATILAVFYGLTDEFHQMFIPGRSADFRDVIADGLGGLLGAGAAAAFGSLRG